MKDKHIKTTKIKWKKIEKNVFEKQCIENKSGLNISILKIEPHKKISLHKHVETRYNFIIKGSMSDENQKYNKGDIVINEKGSEHYLEAGREGCEFILMWN